MILNTNTIQMDGCEWKVRDTFANGIVLARATDKAG